MRRCYLFFTACLVWASASGQEITRLGTLFDFWQAASGVAVQGDYAYVAEGAGGLRVVNIADSTNPVELAVCRDGIALDVKVSGDYAFVAGTPPLWVVDIHAPMHPQTVTTFSADYSTVSQIALDNQRAVLLTGSGTGVIAVLDVSDPLAPRETGRYVYSYEVCPVAVDVEDTLLAVSEEQCDWPPPYPQVRLFSLADSGALRELGSVSGASYGVGLHYPYLLTTIDGALTVMSVDSAPVLQTLGALALPATDRIVVHDTLAFVRHPNSMADGLTYIASFANPAAPSLIDSFATPPNAAQCYADGQVYSADGGELRAEDVRDPQHPVDALHFARPGELSSVIVRNGLAVVADDHKGLWTVNVANPSQPEVLGFWPHNFGWYVQQVWCGDYVYAAVRDIWSHGFEIVDVSDPAHPTEVGVYDSTIHLDVMAVQGNLAFLLDETPSLRLLNVSNPAQPIEISNCALPTFYSSVLPNGDRVVVVGASGACVVDIGTPAAPRVLGHFELHNVPPVDTVLSGPAVSGNLLYVSATPTVQGHTERPQLEVFDLSDPNNPPRVREQTSFWESYTRTALHDHYLIALRGSSSADQLRVWDISQLDNIRLTGSYPIRYQGLGFDVQGNLAYLAASRTLEVLDLSTVARVGHDSAQTPAAFALHEAYPNPFNPSTTLSYSLPRACKVSLKVYDVSGRLARTLVQRQMEAGEYTATFDGSNLASGIYFSRLEAGACSQTQKLVLIK